jgi:hypothetical protein
MLSRRSKRGWWRNECSARRSLRCHARCYIRLFIGFNHIGRAIGLAQRTVANGSWAQGGGSGRGGRGAAAADGAAASNDFRAMKENIYSAAALVSGTDLGLEALSDGRDAVRMDVSNVQKDGGVSMIVNNEWNYPQLGNSNYMKPPITVGEGYENTVRVRFARYQAAP